MKNLIQMKNICKTYNKTDCSVNALSNINLDIYEGDFVAIIGTSGSGKSTLMNIIGCLDIPSEGEYFLDGEDVSKHNDRKLSSIRNKKIGFIFQEFNLISGLNAIDNVEMPLIYRRFPKLKRRQLAEDALQKVGLSKRMTHKPFEMSGGQQQRVAIARAIASQPPIILADEPTGNLDKKSGKIIMDMLCSLNKAGKTIILITHDENVAAMASRSIRISDGVMV